MKIFNCDLDNTLIYSYKHDIGEDKVCVEIYEDREISFMTKNSHTLLEKLSNAMLLVPTTTRSIAQYKRIFLGREYKYALVCNGGVLLVDGEIDEQWYNESLELIKDCREEMDKAVEFLKEDENVFFEIREIEKLFIFTKSNTPEKSVEQLKQKLDLTIMEVFNNGTKVYAVPKILNKGEAILRLKKKLNGVTLIAAGDSLFDVPMLNVADISYAPKTLESFDVKSNFVEDPIFSDGLLKFVLSHLDT